MAKDEARKKPVKIVHPKAQVSFRRNFLPPLLGLLATLIIFGALNSQWLAAKWQYAHMHTAAAAVVVPKTDDGTKIPLGPPRLTINKINVDAPITMDLQSTKEWEVQLALRNGVVRYGNTSLPGKGGDTVIVGHSSGQLWAPGSYKFVFTLLDKLQSGDLIQLDYNGVRYTYKVYGTKVVSPTDLTVLTSSKSSILTLITCTPVGTSNKRLVVLADQISPDPKAANKNTAPEVTKPAATGTTDALPSNSPSLWNAIRSRF